MRIHGFVDIQVNGCNGIDFNQGALSTEEILRATQYLWSKGVVMYCPTIVTNSFETRKATIESIVKAREENPLLKFSICGIHLEGPHISREDGPRGAHNPEFVKDPDWDEFQRLQEVAKGLIKIVTLAPELPGAIAFIEKATQNGIVVAIGHTAATSEDISQAIKVGAKLSTHLGNGAHKILDRNNNYIQYQLAQDKLWASFIADGLHIPFFTLTNYLRAKGTHHSVLISDSIAAAGMGPGKYDLVGMGVEVNEKGFVSLSGTPYLAGSVLDLPRAIKNVARYTGLNPEDVIVMVSQNPAKLLRLEHKLAACQVDLEWGFGDSPDILTTTINGEIVYVHLKEEKAMSKKQSPILKTPTDQEFQEWADKFYIQRF